MIFTCNCNINIDTFNHSYWESKKTTSDEIEIIKFLLNNIKRLKSKNILHIGIGNSFLAEKLSGFNKISSKIFNIRLGEVLLFISLTILKFF